MNTIYILFLLIVSSPGGSPRPAMITQEFSSEQSCLIALKNIQSKVNGRIDLATCEKK